MKSIFTFLIALFVATTLFAQTNMLENSRHKNFAKESLHKQYHENDKIQKQLKEKEHLQELKKQNLKSKYKGKANEQDSLALVALYNGTDGDNWDNNDNWLTGNVVDWHGITLDSNGRVTEIKLYWNQLSDSIPSEIGNLTSLTKLELDRNSLKGNIPAEIGNLTSLTILDLNINYLSGNIPTEIGNLTSITELSLCLNKLSGSIPPQIGNLTSLEWLNLYDNLLNGSVPPEIGNLTKLKRLDLEYNQLTGSIPAEIGNLTNLEELDLANNQLSGKIPAEIGNLISLEWLYLDDNQLTGIPAEIGNLKKLKRLLLNNNKLNGSIPTEIGNLSNLYYLFLYDNQLSGNIPAEIGEMRTLTRIDLVFNQLTGQIPAEIGNLSNLKGLILRNNQLSGNIPAELGNLSNLEGLILGNNQLSGNIPNEIENLQNLTSLSLNNNQFEELPNLSMLTNLYYMNIIDNKFTFEDIEPNVNTASNEFNYSPQAKVGSVKHYLTSAGDNIQLSVTVGGSANTYQWYKNGVAINGAINSTYFIINYDSTDDAGIYICKINNTIATELTLESRNIYVGVDVTTFNVSAIANPGNTGTIAGTGTFNDGDTAEIIATPNTGYDFENWTEDGQLVSVDAIYSFEVDANRNLVANFDSTFYISADPNPIQGGTISGEGNYNYDTNIELTATPETGYRFVNWTEDDNVVSSDLTYSFTVTKDRTLVANFEDPTSVSELENNISFTVYPNPTASVVNIKLHYFELKSNQNVQLNLFDSLGRKREVSTGLINSSIIQIDVSDKPVGIYYLQIIIDNKLFKAVKLIVSK